LYDVNGKVVFISGGARGIGYMIAHAFVTGGARVIISSRDEKACKKASEDLTKIGPGSCYYISGDLSKDDECNRVAEELSKKESQLDVLVNNSGANWGGDIETYPGSAFDKVLALNVKSVFLLTRNLMPLLEKAAENTKKPASVINIGSIDGVRAPSLETYAYSASKSAVHQLTRVMAGHLAKRSIKVNAIAAGPFDTKMMAHVLSQFRDEVAASVPLGRIGNSDDIGALAVFLGSAGSQWLTGAIIPLDGGLLVSSNL